MSGRVVSDIQTRAEGESLYIRYNTDIQKRIYKKTRIYKKRQHGYTKKKNIRPTDPNFLKHVARPNKLSDASLALGTRLASCCRMLRLINLLLY